MKMTDLILFSKLQCYSVLSLVPREMKNVSIWDLKQRLMNHQAIFPELLNFKKYTVLM